MPTLNIVGAGRLGKAFGRLLQQQQLTTIQHICNQSFSSAQAAAAFIGQGDAVPALAALAPADITLITTPDDAITDVCQQLVAQHKIKPGSIVVHCSGALGSDILAPAQFAGAFVASMHPLKSVADSAQAVKTFAGTFCAIEGADKATKLLHAWMLELDAKGVTMLPEHKILYHAASVLSCAGLTTLFGTTVELYQASGMSAEEAQAMLGPFLQETLDNNMSLGSQKALTGPVARGDHDMLEKHSQVLSKHDGLVHKLYVAMTDCAKKLL